MEKLRVKEFDTVQFTKMVRRTKLFANMQMGLLEKILAWVCLYRYRKGEKICRQGDPGDSFFVVYEGRVAVSLKHLAFFSKKAAMLGPGDCFGEMSLFRQTPRNATVTCEEETKVFVLRSEDFHAALKDNPVFAEEMKRLVAEREFQDSGL
ncbi:MAG: hypothetical protein A2X35_02980 [Elusimicrobia bacterium GWA2_61_42]|nr:MAG: hypothetical protein A2X35_02980 [Elusimicrobia bacterium GWA2_61_42]OGR74795.1 MAG: hypothetical protein A2X38_08515 [Elusimicrobia bacterium GWC2_61_25]